MHSLHNIQIFHTTSCSSHALAKARRSLAAPGWAPGGGNAPPSQRNQRTAGEPAQVSLHLNTCSYTIDIRIYIYIYRYRYRYVYIYSIMYIYIYIYYFCYKMLSCQICTTYQHLSIHQNSCLGFCSWIEICSNRAQAKASCNDKTVSMPALDESPKHRGFQIHSFDDLLMSFLSPIIVAGFANFFCLKNVSGIAHCFAVPCISLTSNERRMYRRMILDRSER